MTLTIRVDDAQERALAKLAADTGRTKSYYVKQALDQFLEGRADYLTALAALEADDGRRHLPGLAAGGRAHELGYSGGESATPGSVTNTRARNPSTRP